MIDAFEAGHAGCIGEVLGIGTRVKGLTKFFHESGLFREQFYRSVSEHPNPMPKTTLAVCGRSTSM